MYLQKHFEESDVATMHALIRAQPLATWVTQADGELLVNHVPLLLQAGEGPNGTLCGHLPRANPAASAFSKTADSVFVFHGPQAYITPGWYASKREHGKVVPTWNYAVVHAHGMPRIVDDAAWLREHLEALTRENESGEATPWQVSDAPDDYIAQLMKTLVGIEIPIRKLVGKWKVSQNRPAADRQGVVAGLMARGDDASAEMAALVRERLG